MPPEQADADAVLRAEAPAVWAALSPLGRRMRQPADFLPQQSAEARGKAFNATIGQITDGHGGAVALPAVAGVLATLSAAERSQALLYSPVEGLPELRRLWRERQRRGRAATLPSSLPIVTAGSAQARALAAELFACPGRAVLLSEPCPSALHELFTIRLGANVLGTIPAGKRPAAGQPGTPLAIACLLEELPKGEPAMVVLDQSAYAGFPPGARSLAAAAADRPLVVMIDDGDSCRPDSLFWDLLGRHPNLVPILVEGAEGLGFAGAGVGFLTLPFAADTPLAAALESKLRMLLRAAVGSPPAATQTLLLAALRACA